MQKDLPSNQLIVDVIENKNRNSDKKIKEGEYVNKLDSKMMSDNFMSSVLLQFHID